MSSFSDVLTLSFDYKMNIVPVLENGKQTNFATVDETETALIVMRTDSEGKTQVLKTFYGSEAIAVYNCLVKKEEDDEKLG